MTSRGPRRTASADSASREGPLGASLRRAGDQTTGPGRALYSFHSSAPSLESMALGRSAAAIGGRGPGPAAVGWRSRGPASAPLAALGAAGAPSRRCRTRFHPSASTTLVRSAARVRNTCARVVPPTDAPGSSAPRSSWNAEPAAWSRRRSLKRRSELLILILVNLFRRYAHTFNQVIVFLRL